MFTHVVLRVRGDGRGYFINLATSGYYDQLWNDSYHYIMFTRGGPYWQVVRVCNTVGRFMLSVISYIFFISFNRQKYYGLTNSTLLYKICVPIYNKKIYIIILSVYSFFRKCWTDVFHNFCTYEFLLLIIFIKYILINKLGVQTQSD